jgi:FtsH-binding integral membrane protein
MTQAKVIQAQSEVRFNRFLALVYLVMSLGLAITALVSSTVSSNEDFVRRIIFNPWLAFGLFLLQLVIVVALSGAVMRMSTGAAFLLFIFYAALTGVSLSSIFLYYSQTTIAYTFWVTAGMFLFSSVIGLFIRRDISAAGRFLLIALMGWLFALFLSWFFPYAAGLNQAMTFVGILLFAGLTVWDTQRLKQLSTQLEGSKGMGGMVVIGALALYLDFINLFLLILRTTRR